MLIDKLIFSSFSFSPESNLWQFLLDEHPVSENESILGKLPSRRKQQSCPLSNQVEALGHRCSLELSVGFVLSFLPWKRPRQCKISRPKRAWHFLTSTSPFCNCLRSLLLFQLRVFQQRPGLLRVVAPEITLLLWMYYVLLSRTRLVRARCPATKGGQTFNFYVLITRFFASFS